MFRDEASLSGNNKKYQGLHNRLAPLYDLGIRLYVRLKSGGEENRRVTTAYWNTTRYNWIDGGDR